MAAAGASAKWLAWASLGWLCIEGGVGVAAGIVAGSVALVGFGLDSAIEGLASFIVVWRFTGSRTLSETSERTAQKLVAVSFFLLAPYVATESVRALLGEHHAETSVVGIILTAGTLAICPGLGSPSDASAKSSALLPPGAKARRTSCVPTSPPQLSSVSSRTPRQGSGGLIPWQDYSSPRPAYGLVGKPGVARRAAAARRARPSAGVANAVAKVPRNAAASRTSSTLLAASLLQHSRPDGHLESAQLGTLVSRKGGSRGPAPNIA